MGCGQSKINIYPRKSKGKNSSKKNAAGEKVEGEEEDGGENEQDVIDGDKGGTEDDDGKKKPARTKPIVGGPLVAQTELSNSQQNFFRMLDEKIENGPDYDPSDETEIALETARLHSLLKDWETASASSRSLPSTPRHAPRFQQERTAHSAPKSHSRIPQNVIHQGYGISPPIAYRQSSFNPTYQYVQTVPKAVPYHQDIGQNYSRYYPPEYYQPNNSPKHHKYPQNSQNLQYNIQNSPPHKIYGNAQQNQGFSNGELIIQQQLYSQQVQYQQSREYQQYRHTREQLLVQQQICGAVPQRGTHYQSSVHVPIVAVLPQNEQSPNLSLQRKQQRQYSQEMT